jgi:CheY-like chemotaxis protein
MASFRFGSIGTNLYGLMTPQQAIPEGPATILVVEDDEEIRDILGDLLEQVGYDVIPASNGKQAIDYLVTTRAPPALILLDLMMPIVNGWECLRAIKRHARSSTIPVIVMTGVGRDRPPGVQAVLTKPFRIEDLLATVLRVAGPKEAHVEP